MTAPFRRAIVTGREFAATWHDADFHSPPRIAGAFLPIAVLVLVLATLTSCGSPAPAPPHDSQAGLAACNGPGRHGYSSSFLRREFDSTGPRLVHWQLTRNGPTGPRAVSQFVSAHAKDARVYVCYFDGDYACSQPPPQPPATPGPGYNRVLILVSLSGDAQLDSCGYHNTPGRGPGHGELQLLRPS
jgi:hypothetical protein